jgi:Cytochrome c552
MYGKERSRYRTAPQPGRLNESPDPVNSFAIRSKAQFYLDFVEAENSTGFHAPHEAARILGKSINFSRQGQNALRGDARQASQSAPQARKAALK